MPRDAKTRNGQATVVAGNTLLFLVQTTATTSEQWRWCVSQLEALAASNPDGIVFFQFLLPSADPPSAAIRTQIQNDLARLGPKIRKMVTVVFGDSMRQSIVRTLMRGMLLLGGLSKQQAIVATLEDGASIVREAGGANVPSRAEITAAADALFEALQVDRTTYAALGSKGTVGSVSAE